MEELDELAELGKEWRDRARRARYEKATAGKIKNMDIDELMHICPIGDDDREKLRGERVTWNRASAALVWTVLTAHGGQMDARQTSPRPSSSTVTVSCRARTPIAVRASEYSKRWAISKWSANRTSWVMCAWSD